VFRHFSVTSVYSISCQSRHSFPIITPCPKGVSFDRVGDPQLPVHHLRHLFGDEFALGLPDREQVAQARGGMQC
jgi:hypothetical protein